MPRVSVIIATYNRAKFLQSAIMSVLNQTFRDFEIVVVDDASKDHTADVVRGINDKRIRYIRHPVNQREAGAKNTGLLSSSGEYIAFLDDDDEWLPEKLRLQIELLENSPAKIGGVYSGYMLIDRASGNIIDIEIPYKRGDLYQELLRENCLNVSMLLRRKCFEQAGLFDVSVPFSTDYDMWIRISRHFQFEYIKVPLLKFL